MNEVVKKILPHAVALTLFLLPFQTALMIRSPQSGTYGSISLMALDILLLFVCLLGMGYVNTARKNTAIAGFIVFAAYAFFSALWSPDATVSMIAAVRMAGIVAFCILVAATRGSHRYYMTAIIASATLQSGMALWQFAVQEVAASSWLGMAYHSAQQLGDSVVEVFDQRWLRAYGALPHPNILAAFLVMGLFMCLALAARLTAKRNAFFLLACWSVIVAGLFVTFSREGWIGALIGCAVFAAVLLCKKHRHPFHRYKEKRFSILTLMSFAGSIVIVMLSVAYWEPLHSRLSFAGHQRLEQRSIDERVASFASAETLIKKYPLFGTGMYGAPIALKRIDAHRGIAKESYTYQAPHNFFLVLISELGIFGFIIFFIAIILFIRLVRRSLADPAIIGLCAAVIIISLFDHFYWTTAVGMVFLWLAFAFLNSPVSIEE